MPRYLAAALALVLAGGIAPPPAAATDHWDGPAVMAEPAADITDFFAVSLPGKRLALIMNVYPGATADTRFSDAVEYRVRLRPISGFSTQPLRAQVNDALEYLLRCRADAATAQTMRCALLRNGQKVTEVAAPVNLATGAGDPRLRVFAGNRADQSFTDLARVRMPVWRDEGMDNRPGLNSLAGKNVLSMVFLLDAAQLESKLWAAVSETHTTGSKPVQIDRMGRIEMTVFLIRDDKLKDLWNAEDSFRVDPEHEKLYRPELQSGLSRLDNFEKTLDGSNVIDWTTPHPLMDLLLDDFLILNLERTATMDSQQAGYLSVEKSLVLGQPVQSMGGRLPNEDVIKSMMTLLINGPRRDEPNRGVGVHAPAKPAVAEFPYVQPASR
ncbi:DUF4331 domain-containing protein [Duganella sp. FT135W]|uniref:DUF4331 domain-containing protein n=1 Tax=Duganella flavida TaxID=2692175 RepID=A0A6L8KCM4_9BURK|nr:DUF4331 family protein [Duganella flavida]MYM22181.1 DUF4331 domain-containing protein [Duganella flavida]